MSIYATLRRWLLPALIAITALAGVTLAPAASAAPSAALSAAHSNRTLRIIDLGTLSKAVECCSEATGINNRGQVAGNSNIKSSGFAHAFIWYRGKMRDLGTLGGTNSYAMAINNQGTVVGTSDTRSGTLHAFIWRHGRMHDLGTLGHGQAIATGINNHGDVVGPAQVSAIESDPVLWRHGRIHASGWPPVSLKAGPPGSMISAR